MKKFGYNPQEDANAAKPLQVSFREKSTKLGVGIEIEPSAEVKLSQKRKLDEESYVKEKQNFQSRKAMAMQLIHERRLLRSAVDCITSLDKSNTVDITWPEDIDDIADEEVQGILTDLVQVLIIKILTYT